MLQVQSKIWPTALFVALTQEVLSLGLAQVIRGAFYFHISSSHQTTFEVII
jgi:hypothetical protein